MVGREPERAQIEQMLDRVPSGPSGLALEGAPGIGKTTLWREAVVSARERGYGVMATSPGEPDAGLAFAGLGDLFEGVSDEILARLPDPQRRALSVALLTEGDQEASPDPRALPRAVLGVLRAISAEGSLLIAIDDEQWLDPASARVLMFALGRLRDEPIGVVLARRQKSGGMLSDELADAFGAGGLPVVAVGPLDANSIRDLVANGNSRDIRRPLMLRIHEMSQGNPLYALAIARELDARPGGSRDLTIPRSLEDAIARRLEHLEQRARDPLLVVAALSHPTIALVHAVLSDFRLGDLDGAVTAGVVEIARERVRFTHPLLASTLYSRAPAARRREIHRVIAKVVDDEEQRARHLALGAETPDRRIAVAIEEAAKAAARRGAPDVAAGLLEDAARLTPARDLGARRSRLVEAAELYTAGGDAALARELLESLLPELARGPLRARALFQLALARTDDRDAAAAILDEALCEVGRDDPLRVQIESLAAGVASNRGDFAATRDHSSAALECARRIGDPGLIAYATTEAAGAAVFTGRPIDREALLQVAELAESDLTATAQQAADIVAEVLYFTDDYDLGRPAMERAVERARERGEPYDVARVLFELALFELFAGHTDTAERHRVASADAVGDETLDLWLACGEAMFAAARGHLEYARNAAQPALKLAEREHDPLIGALPIEVLGSVELWNGNPAKAHELIHPVRESLTVTGFGFIGSLSLPLWWIDIEALIACGRLDEAEGLVADLLDRSQIAENPNATAIAERCRGLLLAARGDVGGAITAMDAALAAHEGRTLRPELARTLLEKGSLQRRAKQKRAARDTIERALVMFEGIGAQMWIDRARDELNRIGFRRASAGDGLTPAQTRVAQLVVAGMSNREIASTLYMSQRSVEAHLTKIYREFGVRSRAQLLAALTRTAGQSPIQPGWTPGDQSAGTSATRGSQAGR